MTEIKPVAWVERTEDGHDRMWSGDLAAWANRPAVPEPLYDQSTVNALRKDAEMLRWLATYPNLYTVTDLLRADQYVTLRRACEALMPQEGANT